MVDLAKQQEKTRFYRKTSLTENMVHLSNHKLPSREMKEAG